MQDFDMAKSWMTLQDGTLLEYEDGVQLFLNFAYSSTEPWEKIRCPCKICNNVYYQNTDDVEADLLQYEILHNYVTCVLHGEELDESENDFDLDEEKEDEEEEEEGNDYLGFDELQNGNK
ncbi:hypothetical protein Salat_0650200 [Sesamum alatum]|uniref:Transposase-associated domain-containing protein n=1 Tax=Sesamum alatum TaxID=300844 RepID=A0AAE1YRU1_9LAMI|nr:hypothetical protein Salat_0650200 [Sesamum alatum]